MFEAYKVGITVALINHVSSGMGHIISSLTGGGAAARGLQQELGKIKLLATGTSMVAGAGFMGLGMIGKTIKPASEYVHQLVMMNNEGMRHVDILKATQASWDATKIVPSSSVSDNLSTIRELKMVTGNIAHAIEYMPTLQKVQGILGAVRHDQSTAKHESYELAKSMEMKGSVQTPQQFVGAADLMTKAIVASGGKIGATDFLSAFKYGRAATAAWNDDFTYKILPTLIQEMKGGGSGGATGGPGSALMSMYAAVVGGSVTQRSLGEWQKLGLLDPKKIVWTKDGHAKGVGPGGVAGSQQFQANPYEWVQRTLVPALNKAGITTDAGIRQTLQYMFPNRTAGFIATQFALQSWKFERDRKLIDQAHGLGGYDELLKTDPMLAKMALAKQWESLLAILGYQIMPELIGWMQTGITVTRTLSGWLHKHKDAAYLLVGGFTALSGVLAISGTLGTLYFGFRALQLVLPIISGALGIAGVSGGFQVLINVLSGPVGLVAATAVAAIGIGTLIDMLWLKGRIGKWAFDKFGSTTALTNPSDWDGNTYTGAGIKSAGKSGQLQPINLYVDGKRMAGVVVDHINKATSGPQKGSSLADYMMSVPTVATGGF